MRKLVSVLVVVSVFALLAGCSDRGPRAPDSRGLSYPSRPITLLVGFDPGTGADISARTLAQLAESHLGQSINIVNRPGTSGAVSFQEIFTTRNDGYTIAMGTLTLVANNLMGVINFTFRDLTPIVTFQTDPSVLFVSSSAPFSTWDGMVEYAKANPGRLNVSVSSPGGLTNIAAQLMMKEAGIDWNLIVGTGGGIAGVTQAAGGHVDMAVGAPVEGLSFVQSGDLIPIAVTSPTRLAVYPDVPTCVELGVNVNIGNIRGLFGPPNMDPQRVDILRAAFDKAIADIRFSTFLDQTGAALLHLDSAQTVKAFDDIERDLIPIFAR